MLVVRNSRTLLKRRDWHLQLWLTSRRKYPTNCMLQKSQLTLCEPQSNVKLHLFLLCYLRGPFDTPEWKLCISQPSLPYVLKMLTGLSHWHTKTQEALMEAIPELHLLEQVASEQHIGTLAENLLEVMAEHPPCFAEVSRVVHLSLCTHSTGCDRTRNVAGPCCP